MISGFGCKIVVSQSDFGRRDDQSTYRLRRVSLGTYALRLPWLDALTEERGPYADRCRNSQKNAPARMIDMGKVNSQAAKMFRTVAH